jgi:hypothetical protein
VITSLFNVFFMRIDRGNIKPVATASADEQLDDLESFRCQTTGGFYLEAHARLLLVRRLRPLLGQLPGQRRGPPLSPRFISIKGRDLMFKNYPIYPYGTIQEKRP